MPKLLKNIFADQPVNRESCDCFEHYYRAGGEIPDIEPLIHADVQDRNCSAWRDLLLLIDKAAKDRRKVFAPGKDLGATVWSQIKVLPREISKLKHVRHLQLYGSYLVRIPREVGEMTSLEKFTPYTSYKLHWFPYELTRCKNLVSSTISTRALYGNFKFRPHFPNLSKNPVKLNEDIYHCSICDQAKGSDELEQYWVSLPVGTDMTPLLVFSCSQQCLDSIPRPPDGYVQRPHKGGIEVVQPSVR